MADRLKLHVCRPSVSLECVSPIMEGTAMAASSIRDKKASEKKKPSSSDTLAQSKKSAAVELSDEDLKKVTGAAVKKNHY